MIQNVILNQSLRILKYIIIPLEILKLSFRSFFIYFQTTRPKDQDMKVIFTRLVLLYVKVCSKLLRNEVINYNILHTHFQSILPRIYTFSLGEIDSIFS